MTRIELYLVSPARQHPVQYGKWSVSLDLPPGIFWRQDHGQPLPLEERLVKPGETLELVALEIDEGDQCYHGLTYGAARRLHILRRVRLGADDSYTELFHSRRYEQWRAEGSLRDFDLHPWLPWPKE